MPRPPVLDPESHLRDKFSDIVSIPDVEWDFFWPNVKRRTFAAGAHVYQERRPANEVHYIVQGLIRIYQNGDGVEYVRGFDFEGRFIAVYESVLTGGDSKVNMQALEPLQTLAFPAPLLLQLYERHRCWDRFGRKILEQMWLQRQDKEMRFSTLSPEEHYRLLLERNSPLIGRVPLRQLASYLRIAPETLSRIRARVHRTSEIAV